MTGAGVGLDERGSKSPGGGGWTEMCWGGGRERAGVLIEKGLTEWVEGVKLLQ